jgi:cytochrome c-type biogenesis protein CcmH
MNVRGLSTAIYGMLIAVCVVRAATAQTAAPPGSVRPPPPAVVADSALEARTSAVASQLRCPVCQGLSIQDSPAELAVQMRSLVREQIAAGKSPDEVKAFFVSKYGEWILLAPKPHGFNLLAYLVPILAVLGGGIAVALAVRRWTTGAGSVPAP